MTNLNLTTDFDLGDKTIGTGEKNAIVNVGINHDSARHSSTVSALGFAFSYRGNIRAQVWNCHRLMLSIS